MGDFFPCRISEMIEQLLPTPISQSAACSVFLENACWPRYHICRRFLVKHVPLFRSRDIVGTYVLHFLVCFDYSLLGFPDLLLDCAMLPSFASWLPPSFTNANNANLPNDLDVDGQLCSDSCECLPRRTTNASDWSHKDTHTSRSIRQDETTFDQMR